MQLVLLFVVKHYLFDFPYFVDILSPYMHIKISANKWQFSFLETVPHFGLGKHNQNYLITSVKILHVQWRTYKTQEYLHLRHVYDKNNCKISLHNKTNIK
jgi:hypothetical protein